MKTETMDPSPAEPVLIDYQTPDKSPWCPMIRLMAFATMAKGASNALYWIWYLGQYTFPMRRAMQGRELLVFATCVLPALFELGFFGAGWLCWRFEARGRIAALWLSMITVALTTLSMVVQLSSYFMTRSTLFREIVPSLLSVITNSVLPITIWLFFRRPEVVTEMAQ